MDTFVKDYVEEIIRDSMAKAMEDMSVQMRDVTETNKDHVHQNPEISGTDNEDCDGETRISDDIGLFAQKVATECIETAVDVAVGRKCILSVGIVCLDLITVCQEFPREDTETLALEHYWSRGGNAANTATVLAHLGARVEFLGTLVNNRWKQFLLDDFKESGVSVENCVHLDLSHKAPVSTLILSETTSTRTALPDFKDVTEICLDNFNLLNLDTYKWIHFEGRRRNLDLVKMLERVEQYNETSKTKVKVSVEIEQPHSICPELRPLFSKADVVLVSKDYAIDAGFKSKEEAVKGLYPRCKPEALLICAWGDKGAAGLSPEGEFVANAVCPEKLVDTLGAGDTFNASVIYALSRNVSLQETLKFACKVAGTKCGSRGFTSAKQFRYMIQ